MNAYALLADFGQDWSLMGQPVWFSLVFGIAGALATVGCKDSAPGVRLRLTVILPAIAFGLCLLISLKNWPVYYWKTHYAQLDVAFVINFALGVGFTLGALRTRTLICRACGGGYVLAYGWLFSQSVQYAKGMRHWWE